MSAHAVALLTTDLRHQIGALGQQGGVIGPSIYDTAQVLRLCPHPHTIAPAMGWLIEQQQEDGGWGNPAIPRARTMPSLAAVLALHTHARSPQQQRAVEQGLAFLQRNAALWHGTLPDELPAGIELLLPRLSAEALQQGLKVPRSFIDAFAGLGQRRRSGIAHMRPAPATTVVHSWEAWGHEPDPALLDGAGSIGHSPAATAAWLAAAAQRPDLRDACEACRRYLDHAAAATGLDIPGIFPTAWPINRFEQAFSLYILLLADRLDDPALHDAVQPQIEALAHALGPEGLGFSDWFAADGDNTAATVAVLQATGHTTRSSVLNRFIQGDHFASWKGELQQAPSVTAHALHALMLSGAAVDHHLPYLLDRQQPDGRWIGDKWNASWIYTTWQASVVLIGTGHDQAIRRALDALLAAQMPDGSWGMHGGTAEETAYAILALRALRRAGIDHEALERVLSRGERWMQQNYRPLAPDSTALWLAKETYRAPRLSRIIELAATLPDYQKSERLR